MNEIYEWNEPVNKWSHRCIGDYIIWVKEAYGMKEAKKLFKYAKQYRAIKDLNASVKQEINQSVTDALAHSMMHTKEVIAANILQKHFKEHLDYLDEHNNDRL